MRRIVSLLMAMVAGITSGCDAVGAYPMTEVLDAGKRVCTDLSDQSAIVASAEFHQWHELVGADVPDGLPRIPGNRYFSKTVAGEDLSLVALAPQPDSPVMCQVYDLGETRMLDPAKVASWAKRSPSEARTRDDGGIYTWRPGVGAGHSTFEVIQMEADSLPARTLGWNGVMIIFDKEE